MLSTTSLFDRIPTCAGITLALALFVPGHAVGQLGQSGEVTDGFTAGGETPVFTLDRCALDQAGYGGALDVDGDLLVVATAPPDTFTATSALVWVYRNVGGDWVPEQQLFGSDVAAKDLFGTRAVAVSGDVIAVGCWADDDGAQDAGSVYIFRHETGTWQEEVKLRADDPRSIARFGSALALDGDRLVVGANGDPFGGGYLVGSAWVFDFDGTTWNQTAELRAPDADHMDFFGSEVFIEGDTLLVSAPGDDEAALDAGASYVIRLIAGSWSFEHKLMAPAGQPHEKAGVSVALWGDEAFVGAFADHPGGLGLVHRFREGADGWTYVEQLGPSDAPSYGDGYGKSLAVSEDRLVVGAPYDRWLGASTGALYVLRRSGADWIEEQKLLPSQPETGGRLGDGLATDGARIVAGAPWGTETNGLAYSFVPDTGLVAWVEECVLAPPGGLSLSLGGLDPMHLVAGQEHAGDTYWLLGSMSGTTPGTLLQGGVLLPLNAHDRYYRLTVRWPSHRLIDAPRGRLDANGEAFTSFVMPPAGPAAWVGLEISHAFVVWDGVELTLLGASNAVSLQPVP